MKIQASWDDGCASDVRVAQLMQKYEIPTVFYWPVEWRSLAYDNGYTPLTIIQALAISNQFEIGSHTVTHRHLTNLNIEDAKIEIADSKFMLEALFAKPVTKFCPPRGYTNPDLTDLTSMFYSSQRLTKGLGLVHVHPNSGANKNMTWQEYFGAVKNDTEEIEIWGHSHELDKYNLWDELESFLQENAR